MRKTVLLLALVMIATLVAAGCQPAANPPTEPNGGNGAPTPAETDGEPSPAEPKRTARDYFPYEPGMTLIYEGRGNEFASYDVTVLYAEDGELEWRRDTGGTVMAEVFQVADEAVTLVYREGEAYDNEKRLGRESNIEAVVLKTPIEVGTTWTSNGTDYEITDIDAEVEAVDQTLDQVLIVETRREDSVTRSYYHPDYGLVLSVFESEGTTVESRLKEVSQESP